MNTLDSTDDHNYEENEKISRPDGIYYRILEERYMGEQKEQYATTSTMDNKQHNLLLRRRTCTQKCREKRHFLQHKKKRKSTQMDQRTQEKKVGLAAVFEDITKRGALLEEASIHTGRK